MSDWIIRNTVEQVEISSEYKIPEAIVHVLYSKGYNTPEKIKNFLHPSLSDLNDPFLFQDMEQAVDRILTGIENHEKILIFGDYDVDGVTGIAILIKAISKLGGIVDYYIPHRVKEGYGFSKNGVDYAKKIGSTLIITVDCGITATDAINYAGSEGIDVIICDHHAAHITPEAMGVLDPKVDQKYPFNDLAGCGVAFKLVQGLALKLKRPMEEAYQYLDLVALGTIADVAPLAGENRIITRFGLESLGNTQNIGLHHLIEVVGLVNKTLSSYHVGFMLGPRINAAGRISEAEKGLRLLLTDDHDEARKIAIELNRINQERRDIEKEILDQAIEDVEKKGIKGRVIVLAKEGWHEGVIGIVASRITNRFNRPAFLISISEDKARGSARGIAGFDIYGALSASTRTLNEFGGHREAGGFSLDVKMISQFHDALEEFARSFPDEIFTQRLFIDYELELSEIDTDFLKYILQFEPTGVSNPKPTFLTRDVLLVGYPRIVKNDHLRFAVMKDRTGQQAIFYQKGSLISRIEVGRSRADIVYTVNQDQIAARSKPILQIKEMKFQDVAS